MAETHEIPDRSVIRDTVVVVGSFARILIDRNASHLFIKVSKLMTELVLYILRVDTHVSGVIELREECREYTLTIAGCEFVFGFIVLEITKFNVIVGMDWLTVIRAHSIVAGERTSEHLTELLSN